MFNGIPYTCLIGSERIVDLASPIIYIVYDIMDDIIIGFPLKKIIIINLGIKS